MYPREQGRGDALAELFGLVQAFEGAGEGALGAGGGAGAEEVADLGAVDGGEEAEGLDDLGETHVADAAAQQIPAGTEEGPGGLLGVADGEELNEDLGEGLLWDVATLDKTQGLFGVDGQPERGEGVEVAGDLLRGTTGALAIQEGLDPEVIAGLVAVLGSDGEDGTGEVGVHGAGIEALGLGGGSGAGNDLVVMGQAAQGA